MNYHNRMCKPAFEREMTNYGIHDPDSRQAIKAAYYDDEMMTVDFDLQQVFRGYPLIMEAYKQ